MPTTKSFDTCAKNDRCICEILIVLYIYFGAPFVGTCGADLLHWGAHKRALQWLRSWRISCRYTHTHTKCFMFDERHFVISLLNWDVNTLAQITTNCRHWVCQHDDQVHQERFLQSPNQGQGQLNFKR